MIDIFFSTLPFFMLIGLGYLSCRSGFFSSEATAYLTKFVFYFALSAMLFNFSATLPISEVFDWGFIAAYLWGSLAVYLIATAVAMIRGRPLVEAAFEAQCAVIGNVGFLGIPMLVVLLGEMAAGPVLLVLSIDLIVFSSLIVVIVNASRDGRMSPAILKVIGLGLAKNPMIVSIAAGLAWSTTGWTLPAPADSFLTILGAAATPCALFAIGASLADKSAERLAVAGWLSMCKLVLHPAAVAVAALFIFPVEPFSAGVMIAAAALPVAGNVFILAQHFGVAPQRVSATILLSTMAAVISLSVIIAWLAPLTGS